MVRATGVNTTYIRVKCGLAVNHFSSNESTGRYSVLRGSALSFNLSFSVINVFESGYRRWFEVKNYDQPHITVIDKPCFNKNELLALRDPLY